MVRTKNRWVIVKANATETTRNSSQALRAVLRPNSLKAEIERSCEILFGLLGGALVSNSVSVPFVNQREQLVLLNCRRSQLRELLLVLRFINRVQNVGVSLEVLSVSGTLHRSRGFILERLYDSLSKLVVLNSIRGEDKLDLISGINRIQLVNTTN